MNKIIKDQKNKRSGHLTWLHCHLLVVKVKRTKQKAITYRSLIDISLIVNLFPES